MKKILWFSIVSMLFSSLALSSAAIAWAMMYFLMAKGC